MNKRILLVIVGILAIAGLGLAVATQYFGLDLSRGSAAGVIER